MNTRFLLFVDDREDQQLSFQDAVEAWNDANADVGKRFIFKIRDNYPDAVEALTRYRFDGALFDLRLPSPEPGVQEAPLGNSLAQEALHRHGIPVAIITALQTELATDVSGADAIKIFDKGDADIWAGVIDWFAQKWEMMEVLAASRAHIRSISAEIFANRVWPRWSDYVAAAGASLDDLAPVVTRQFVWHMSEVLGLGGETNELWHPFESWLCPPRHAGRAETGDVFRFDDELWIVLSPACDMANDGKITDVLLAKCDRDALPDWADRVTKLNEGDEGQKKKASDYFRRLVNQSAPAQHFLPPLPNDPRPLVVQFTNITTRPIAELQDNLTARQASVSAPFLSNITQRFGSYISRVGQPNLDVSQFSG